ncbi:diaminopimelate decarboxylase [Robertmurraya sp. FSL W8-0741]|uniref:diaminopimelate decarboxylase n=1 Tax=Robertmurraya sp. FSL W8-0741 TaxID=2954629 RepID=UPI0030F50647
MKSSVQDRNLVIDLMGKNMNYEIVQSLAKSCGGAFFLLDLDQLENNYHKINQAFKKQYNNFIIAYSYKTNYLPALCKKLISLGAYSEVVSRLEYDLALRLGENGKHIIFNGPIKSKEDIYFALQQESIINLDSFYEIDYVKQYASENPSRSISLGVRVNFALMEDGESILQDGYDVSRFGFSVENGDLERAIYELKKIAQVKIIGLHGHFSTRTRSLAFFRHKTERLCQLAKKYINETLQFIDIGGGIYGELPKSFNRTVPSFDDYAAAIGSVMRNEFAGASNKPKLILEPGVSMVANTMSFACQVMEHKRVQGTSFILVDGSAYNIKPTMHRSNLPFKIVAKNHNSKLEHLFHIVGYTCMERDYLAQNVQGTLPQQGDYLIFEQVGAYTLVLNPLFIKERPAVVAREKGQAFLIRKKETLADAFNENIYRF